MKTQYTQKTWGTAKAWITKRFRAINVYIKNDLSQISNITLHLKKLKKEEQTPQSKQKEGKNKD